MVSPLIRLRTLFRRKRLEQELDAELQFHLDMQVAEYVRQGMSPERARVAARQLFGGVEGIKDDVRDTWLTRLVETGVQDARYSLRGLRKHAGYTLAVIVTMALGIGANSAIFSVVNAVLLQPLPYTRGDDMVLLRQERTGVESVGFSLKDIDDLRTMSKTLDAVVEYHSMYFILLGGAEPARVTTGVVSWDYFDVLGVEPLLGRTFRAGDDAHDAKPVLVLSHEYWQRVFKGDPAIVGRVFDMNDRPHVVVGVLPELPMFPKANDVYMPRRACPFRMLSQTLDRRGGGMAAAFGRRAPGTTVDATTTELDTIGQQLTATYPRAYPVNRGHRLTATPLRREFTRGFESTLLFLLGTAGFVLLIVCASVANLAIARALRRDREFALRAALGASRSRLLRQLVTESVILSFAGGAAGLLLAFVGRNVLVSYVERFTTRAVEIRIDGTVLLFTLVVSLVTGLVAGMLPAISRRLNRRPVTIPGPTPVARRDIRRALIVAQVAASFMLLIGAGLMLRSLMKLAGVDPGFNAESVLTLQIDMNFSKYRDAAERAAYLDRILTSLREIPEVSEVGASGTIPFLEGAGQALSSFVVQGRQVERGHDVPRATVLFASDGYFGAMGIPLVSGRFFTRHDTLDEPLVAIVNRSLAERYWPDTDPVGQRISGEGVEWHTIVGVVENVRQQLSLDPRDEIYAPMGQMPYLTSNWAIRSTRDLSELGPLVRAAVQRVEPDQPIYRMRPLTELRSASLAPPRLTAALLGIFALLALVITATGIAGVIAFSVTQRTQEFGVRVALGANRRDVVSMVVAEGLRLTLTGLAIGAAAALLLSGGLSTMLFRIEPTDTVTYVAVSSVLLLVASAACLLPALRAASVNPIDALRAA